jgi:hypothetical protein
MVGRFRGRIARSLVAVALVATAASCVSDISPAHEGYTVIAINDHDVILRSGPEGPELVPPDGPPRRLAPLPAGQTLKRVSLLNNDDVVVGEAEEPQYGGGGQYPVVWDRDGTLIDLRPWLQASNLGWGAWPMDLSDTGLVYGRTFSVLAPVGERSFVWNLRDRTVRFLPDGLPPSVHRDGRITDDGVILASHENGSVIMKPGPDGSYPATVTPLPIHLTDANNRGDIAGYVVTGAPPQQLKRPAVLKAGATEPTLLALPGSPVDQPGLVAPLVLAYINDRGSIAVSLSSHAWFRLENAAVRYRSAEAAPERFEATDIVQSSVLALNDDDVAIVYGVTAEGKRSMFRWI